MILAKYKGRVVFLTQLEYEPHISFLPDKHEYWVRPLEEAYRKPEMRHYVFQTQDVFEVKLSDLSDIFIQITTLKKLLNEQQNNY